jgi:hypothetical protein
VLTPFEKNLEVWRQLWRVLERSDVVVQVGGRAAAGRRGRGQWGTGRRQRCGISGSGSGSASGSGSWQQHVNVGRP